LLLADVAKGFASFFLVGFGGTTVGIIWGFLVSFATRFTRHVRILEPLLVISFAYVAYVTAEMFHMSGILSITFFGITAQGYVEKNISPDSQVSVKYLLKMMSVCSEAIIFMFLGVETINEDVIVLV
jgi:NhaP-type Na+/H+ or K+/H+ antiporter